jgi:hypothetical protein
LPLPERLRQDFLDWQPEEESSERTQEEKGGSVAGLLTADVTAPLLLLHPELILEPFSFPCPFLPQKKESVSVLLALAEQHNLTW